MNTLKHTDTANHFLLAFNKLYKGTDGTRVPVWWRSQQPERLAMIATALNSLDRDFLMPGKLVIMPESQGHQKQYMELPPECQGELANIGSFIPASWEMHIHKAVLMVSFPKQADMIQLLRVIYHELRHCEQYYHLARYIAGVVFPQSKAREVTKKGQQLPQALVALCTQHQVQPNLYGEMVGFVTRQLKDVSDDAITTACQDRMLFRSRASDHYFGLATSMYEALVKPGTVKDHTEVDIMLARLLVEVMPSEQGDIKAYELYFGTAHEKDAKETETLLIDAIRTQRLFREADDQ